MGCSPCVVLGYCDFYDYEHDSMIIIFLLLLLLFVLVLLFLLLRAADGLAFRAPALGIRTSQKMRILGAKEEHVGVLGGLGRFILEMYA